MTKEAIWLMLHKRVICATTKVKRIAYVGSSLPFVPWPKIEKPGSRLSRARAWSSLADPMTPIKDEKNDVANSPRRTSTPDRLV